MGGESPIGYIAIYSPPYREGLGGGSRLLSIGADNIAINKLLLLKLNFLR